MGVDLGPRSLAGCPCWRHDERVPDAFPAVEASVGPVRRPSRRAALATELPSAWVRPRVRWFHLALLALGLLLPVGWLILSRLIHVSDATLVQPIGGVQRVQIQQVYDASSGLQPDDVVLAIDGISIDDWVAHRVPAVHRQVGDLLRYTVERPTDGAPGVVDVDVRLIEYPVASVVAADGVLLVLFVAVFAFVAGVFLVRPFDVAAKVMLTVGLALPWAVTEFPMGLQVIDLAGGTGLPGFIGGDIGAAVMWGGLLHFALVFPEPVRALRDRPRRAVWCYLLVFALYVLSLGWTLPTARTDVGRMYGWISISGTAAIVVPLLVAVLFVRSYRRATDIDVRRRFRWIIASMSVASVLYLGLGQLANWVFGRPLVSYQWLLLGFIPVPLTIAAAVLRYRLFDIEVIVSRSLLVGGLTSVIAASYAVVVLVLPQLALFGAVSTLTALLIGGVITALALTLRKRLARWISTLVYGHRSNPHAVVEQLGRLDTAAAADELLPEVVRTLAAALRLPYVRLELRGPDGVVEVEAEFGTASRPPTVLAIGSGSEVLGELELDAGPGREPFGPADRRLLDDIARHLADASRTVLLARALQRSRERIILAREEERRRLRRDLHDGVGPTLAALAMQLEVAAALISRDPAAATRSLDRLTASTHHLIGDVRRIRRTSA